MSDTSFAPKFTYIHNSKIAVRFDRNCLKQDKVSFTHTNVVNVLIAYKLDLRSRDLGINFTLKDCFSELLTWLRTVIHINILFHLFWFQTSILVKMLLFLVWIIVYQHIKENKKNNEILVIGEGLTQGLNNNTITAKAKYFFSFTVSKNKFCLSVHYNRSNGFSC